MHRRGFIGALLASVAALTLDPATLLWRPPADALALPPVSPTALLSLQQITQALTARVAAQLRGTLVDGSLVGQGPLAHQFNVCMRPPVEVGPEGLEERYIRPASEALVATLQDAHINAFGVLPLRGGVEMVNVIDPRQGIAMRGALVFDMEFEEYVMRFDALCGRA